MLLRKFSITAIVALLFVPLVSQDAQAATFTTQEINEIHNFQKEYASLDKTNYSASNIYAVKPHLSKKFKAGRLRSKYINTQIDYINYYRSLFGLSPVTTSDSSNSDTQKQQPLWPQSMPILLSINTVCLVKKTKLYF